MYWGPKHTASSSGTVAVGSNPKQFPITCLFAEALRMRAGYNRSTCTAHDKAAPPAPAAAPCTSPRGAPGQTSETSQTCTTVYNGDVSTPRRYRLSGRPPVSKKGKMEDGKAVNGSSSYIPTEKDDGPQFSVVFSMKEEKGALVRALELCKVS